MYHFKCSVGVQKQTTTKTWVTVTIFGAVCTFIIITAEMKCISLSSLHCKVFTEMLYHYTALAISTNCISWQLSNLRDNLRDVSMHVATFMKKKKKKPKGLYDFTLSVRETFSFSRMQTEHCIFQKPLIDCLTGRNNASDFEITSSTSRIVLFKPIVL